MRYTNTNTTQVIWTKHVRCATVLAVLVRTLSRSHTSHFVAIHSWNVRCSQKLPKKSPKFLLLKVQDRVRSSMLIKLKKTRTSACYDKQHVCTYLQLFSRLAVDMKFSIHIHIHRRLTCMHAALIFFAKYSSAKAFISPRKTWHKYSPL